MESMSLRIQHGTVAAILSFIPTTTFRSYISVLKRSHATVKVAHMLSFS